MIRHDFYNCIFYLRVMVVELQGASYDEACPTSKLRLLAWNSSETKSDLNTVIKKAGLV